LGDSEVQASSDVEGGSTKATITVTLAPKITFASHQNDVPAILDLSVEN